MNPISETVQREKGARKKINYGRFYAKDVKPNTTVNSLLTAT